MFPSLLLAVIDKLPEEKIPPSGWGAIVEGNGISISLTGMSIVFVALAIIATSIAVIPHVLALLEPILPKGHATHASPTPAEQLPGDQQKVVAAIGLVLHTEMQKVSGKTS